MHFDHVNLLAVVVAALASFAFGALWYSPVLFSKVWQKEVGLTEEDIKNGNMLKTFGGSFLLMLVMSLGMAFLLQTDAANLQNGIHLGLFTGVMFVAAGYGINMLYQRKSLKLFLIDAGYQVIMLVIMGGIIRAWR